jgi:CDP-L-myo-inositol myo-inositolphosphotransferase
MVPWLRPNHVTALTAAIAVAMFACFLFGDPAVIVLGGVLFHVASVVDGVDGEMARVSFRSSMRGAMFDIIVDRLTILAFFLGIPIAMARTEGLHHAFVGGWGFAAAAIGCLILARVLRRIEPPRSYWVMEKVVRGRFPKPPLKWIVDFLATCIKRDVFSLVFPLLMVLGLSWTVTWLFTGFTTLWLGVVLSTTPAILRGGVQPRGTPAALPPASRAA